MWIYMNSGLASLCQLQNTSAHKKSADLCSSERALPCTVSLCVCWVGLLVDLLRHSLSRSGFSFVYVTAPTFHPPDNGLARMCNRLNSPVATILHLEEWAIHSPMLTVLVAVAPVSLALPQSPLLP